MTFDCRGRLAWRVGNGLVHSANIGNAFMAKKFSTRRVELAVAVLALVTLVSEPAWAQIRVPGPDASVLTGIAIVGALLVAKWWRRG